MTGPARPPQRTAMANTNRPPSVRANSPDRWKPASARARAAARLQLSEALKLVATMLESFPAERDANGKRVEDPDGYFGSLAGVLCQHPREAAEACANTTTGVTTECLFRHALTPGRVEDWCKRHSAELLDYVQRLDERLEAANDPKTPDMDRTNRPTVEDLRARYGPTFGLKGIDALDRTRGIGGNADDTDEATKRNAEQNRRAVEVSNAVIAGAYAELGVEPRRAGWGNMLISPSLMATLGKPVKCKSPKRQRAAK
jgi:hypothetical protein